MRVRSLLAMYWYGMRNICKNIRAVKNGQSVNYDILQTAHRLEKGLCIRNPRAGWGFDKARRLISLILEEKRQLKPDVKAINIGSGVLAAFVNRKKISSLDVDVKGMLDLEKEIIQRGIHLEDKEKYGGVINLTRDEVLLDESAEKLFLTRHSIRDFSDTPVEFSKLERAVSLALQAPSACNRQASHIYVISGDDRVKAGGGNEYHADKYLIITGDRSAYNLTELNDWIVSTSVFCGYLTLALQAENVGACIFRKEIIKDSKYNNKIRELCHIPSNEQIILEIAIGNYRDEFLVPVSYRRKANEILHFVS